MHTIQRALTICIHIWPHCPGKAKSTSLQVSQTHMQSFQVLAGSSVHLSSHALVTAGDCSSLGCMIMTPEGCQCAPVTRRLHFLGKMSVQILHKLSGPFYSLTEETAKTRFQIGNWINIKNIYTCISTIYHTALIKSGFSGCKYLCSTWKCAYFPDAQICKRIEWYRKIIWTHIRGFSCRKCAWNHKVSFHKKTSKLRSASHNSAEEWQCKV